ncbi:MAG: RidA family protein [Planctomycetota bacterium]
MTTEPEQRLADLGVTLPKAPAPVAAYVPVRTEGGLAIVSGQVPFLDGQLLHTGHVGTTVSLEDGVACARQCAINALAAAKEALGSLDQIKGVVRVGVFVACAPDFTDHPRVANGASELLQSVFGESGRHARAAVGCSSLPLGVPVEVEVTLAIRD